MKHTFGLGMIAGVSSLAIAVPLLAQVAGAASATGSTTTTDATQPTRTPPSQACVQALATQEGVQIAGMDAMMTAHKSALQAHQAALVAAANISDATEREAAIKQANQNLRTAMEAAMKAQAPTQAQQDALKAACGDSFRGGLGFGEQMMGKMGHGNNMLAQKLGVTADTLKAELAGGKTIQQIAQEHGVTLPTFNGKRGGHFGHQETNDDTGRTSSTAQQ